VSLNVSRKKPRKKSSNNGGNKMPNRGPRRRRVEDIPKSGEQWEVIEPAGMDPKLQEALQQMNTKQVALFCAWVINGRNITQAARQIGYNVSYAQRLFTQDPAFQEAKGYLQDIVMLEDQDWIECLPQARQTLRSLLNSPDDKVKYLAAKDIVDRAEGKPIARTTMTLRDERPTLSDGQMQLLFSIMQATGVGFAEAKAWMEKHPEESQRWIAENTKALPAGREIPHRSHNVEAIESVAATVVSEYESEPPPESRITATDIEEVYEGPQSPPSRSDQALGPSNRAIASPPRPLIAKLD
jgi:hypothetical protein